MRLFHTMRLFRTLSTTPTPVFEVVEYRANGWAIVRTRENGGTLPVRTSSLIVK